MIFEEFLNQINQDIKNIFQYNIETTNTTNVPARDDQGLTFPIGADKKGKKLETCVLMIDIRNSTKISRDLKKDKTRLGKIYSAFIYAMTSIADEYGYVRNIVGDRVMVVFEPENCFVNAINCAILMYTVSTKILSKYISLENYKIGIGIDYGEILVLKTGIQKKHEEKSEYKNLVWIGDVANNASKLCDFANKQYISSNYKVTYEYHSYEDVVKSYLKVSPYTSLDEILNKPKTIPIYEKQWIKRTSTTELKSDEFNRDIEIKNDEWRYNNNKVVSISKEQVSGTSSPILMSGKVYSEFKKTDSKSPFLSKFTSKDYPGKPYTGTGIYGGSTILPEILKIKI